MSDSFTRLQELSAHLNQATDKLNAELSRVEKRLAELRIGLHVSVPLQSEELALESPIGDLQNVTVTTYLAYTKHKGTWKLVVGVSAPFGAPEDTPLPLDEISRDLRIKALENIPMLIHQLELNVQQELSEIERARTALASVKL